jgi:hypothetical protein
MAQLSDAQAALFKARNYATIGVLRLDGTAQLTPVWVDWDGEHVVVNLGSALAPLPRRGLPARAG